MRASPEQDAPVHAAQANTTGRISSNGRACAWWGGE
jgi:hypothetical protein